MRGGAQWNGKNLTVLDGNDYAQMDSNERVTLVTILERTVPYCKQTVQQGVDALNNIYSDSQVRGTHINEAFAAWEVLAGCHKP